MSSNKLKNLVISTVRAFIRFLIVLLELIAFVVVLFALQQVSLGALYVIASTLFVVLTFTVITGRGFPHFRHRGKALLFLFFMTFSVLGAQVTNQQQEERWANLRVSDPDGYLSELSEVDEDRWLAELEELKPEEYREEIKKRESEAKKTAAAASNSIPLKPDGEQAALQVSISASGEIPDPCGNGGVVLNDVVAVSGNHEIRVEPTSSASKVKNRKASRIIGEDVFHRIDGSTTVRRLCAQTDWTKVQIVSPDWLTHVRGWVPSDGLREIERTASGERVYVEGDFYWNDDTSKFKPQIIAVVNKIASENRNCRKLDPSSVAKSSSKSKAGDPVFFVTCGSLESAFNVWFRPTDAETGQQFRATEPLAKSVAVNSCEAVAKQAAVHPSTVEFSRLWDLAYMPHVSGRARVISSFTAKNALNLELKYRIECLFDGPTLIETNITESIG
jgi:hypothetical protein